ncbi:intraflagellar transport protein 46 homolog isoform X2 [Limulus polyphemus]|uniref:Intraflagellar transport protein 46 homolog n=1 Tax=Limulus polyphemus TaxID=6850 RepID=A0ABM1RYF4_LIMPO|nr:intraflagellar transport protein 46 homolog isoform X2 [Limulus polyphemus]
MNQPYDETSDISNFQELEARVRRPELDDDPQNREDEETEIQVAAFGFSDNSLSSDDESVSWSGLTRSSRINLDEEFYITEERDRLYSQLPCGKNGRYNTQTIELDHKLKPFIPDFIPAVGDIDAFLKVWILSLCSGEIFMYVSCVSLYW